jgi:hypothetical protein
LAPTVLGASRDGNSGVGHPRILDPPGAGVGVIFNPRVTPAPDPHKTGFGCGFYLAPSSDPSSTQKQPKFYFSPAHYLIVGGNNSYSHN